MDHHDQTISAIHASKQNPEHEDILFDKQLHTLNVLRSKRRKVGKEDEDGIEELAKAIMFDDGVSYNLINSLVQEDCNVQKRIDRCNCLAVLSSGNIIIYPDQSLRRLQALVLDDKFKVVSSTILKFDWKLESGDQSDTVTSDSEDYAGFFEILQVQIIEL